MTKAMGKDVRIVSYRLRGPDGAAGAPAAQGGGAAAAACASALGGRQLSSLPCSCLRLAVLPNPGRAQGHV